MKKSITSKCEQEFVLKAIAEQKRVDGRHAFDYRNISVEFGNEFGLCKVRLGETRVLAQVSCEVVVPQPARPSEGALHLNVELSPMAAPHFEAGRLSEQGVEVNRLLERCVIESKAVDVESLCIVSGEKVWSIRIDAHVLNHDGNMIDCVSIAIIAALAHFRRPDVTMSGEEITIHTLESRNPVPLSIHHWPVCVTFAFFNQGKYFVVDPTELEEQVMDGKMVVGMNVYREICTLHMGGTISLHKEQILRGTQMAVTKAAEIVELVKNFLQADVSRRSRGEKISFSQTICKDLVTTMNRQLAQISLWSVTEEAEKSLEQGKEKTKETLVPELVRVPVIVKGPGTAAIGEGGPCTWVVSDDEDEIQVIESESPSHDRTTTDSKNNKHQKKSTSTHVDTGEIQLDSDDSEEAVVILKPDEVDTEEWHRGNW